MPVTGKHECIELDTHPYIIRYSERIGWVLVEEDVETEDDDIEVLLVGISFCPWCGKFLEEGGNHAQ